VVREPTRLWSHSSVVAVAPDGRLWVRSAIDEIEVTVDDQIVARTRVPNGNDIKAHHIDASGRLLLSVHAGATLYALPTLERLGHWDAPRAAAFSPDGRRIALGDRDGHVQLVDTATRLPLGRPIATVGGVITRLAFTADGSALYVGTYTGGVALVVTDPAAWARLACDLAWGDLAPAEVAAVLGDRSLEPLCAGGG
jgi:WD40 repeat protein